MNVFGVRRSLNRGEVLAAADSDRLAVDGSVGWPLLDVEFNTNLLDFYCTSNLLFCREAGCKRQTRLGEGVRGEGSGSSGPVLSARLLLVPAQSPL
jgi:hypothetical protein